MILGMPLVGKHKRKSKKVCVKINLLYVKSQNKGKHAGNGPLFLKHLLYRTIIAILYQGGIFGAHS